VLKNFLLSLVFFFLFTLPSWAINLAGPGMRTLIIYPDTLDNTAINQAHLFQRYLCFMKFNQTDTANCGSVQLRVENTNDLTVIPTDFNIRIFVGRNAKHSVGYVNTRFGTVLNSMKVDDSFLWGMNAADKTFVIASPFSNLSPSLSNLNFATPPHYGPQNGLANGVYKLLERYAGLFLTVPAVNSSSAGRIGLGNVNDVVPLSTDSILIVPDNDLSSASGLNRFVQQIPSVEQRIYSTNLIFSLGNAALPANLLSTNMSSNKSGKNTITHNEAYLLRPNFLPDGTVPPASYHANSSFYSTGVVPPLSPRNANPPWRSCFSHPEIANTFADALFFQFDYGTNPSMAINDSGSLCPIDTTITNCDNDAAHPNSSLPIVATSEPNSLQSRSAVCAYFQALKKIDQEILANPKVYKPKINFLLHAFLKLYDPRWRFNLSTHFKSIFATIDEAQRNDPAQYAEQYAPYNDNLQQNSQVSGIMKIFPNQNLGIYNYLAEPGFMIPRYYPTALAELIKAKYNQPKPIKAMYSEFYPNPGNITDATLAYINAELTWNPNQTLTSLLNNYTNKVYPGISSQMLTYLNNWEVAWNKQFFLDNPTDPDFQENQKIKKILLETGQTSRSLYRWMNHVDQFLFVSPKLCQSQKNLLQNMMNQLADSPAKVYEKLVYHKRYLDLLCDLVHNYYAWRKGREENNVSDLNVARILEFMTWFDYGTSSQVQLNVNSAYAGGLDAPVSSTNQAFIQDTRDLRPWEGLSAVSRKFAVNKSFSTQAALNLSYQQTILNPLASLSDRSKDLLTRVRPIVIERINAAPSLSGNTIGPEWGAPQVNTTLFGNGFAKFGLNTFQISQDPLLYTASIYFKRFGQDFYGAIRTRNTSPNLFASFPGPGVFLSNSPSTSIQANSYKNSRQFARLIFRKMNGLDAQGKFNEPNSDYIDINPNGFVSFQGSGARTDIVEAQSTIVEGCQGASQCEWVLKFRIKNQGRLVVSATDQNRLYTPSVSLSSSPVGFVPYSTKDIGVEFNLVYWNGLSSTSLFPNGSEYRDSNMGTWLNFPNTMRGYPLILAP
jgi:hypothetical protein